MGSAASNGWREIVSTRQPASLNVFTVAWPIPRLAPVSKENTLSFGHGQALREIASGGNRGSAIAKHADIFI